MPSEEVIVLTRGFIAMLIFIVLGVAAAEHQLNDMTMQSPYVRSFNVRRDSGGYSAHVLGNGININGQFPVGSVYNTAKAITFQSGGNRITIPTVLYFNIERPIYWLNLWYGQFMEEAYRTKENLTGYMRDLKPFLDKELRWLKEQFR
jgi:hypothetical protein